MAIPQGEPWPETRHPGWVPLTDGWETPTIFSDSPWCSYCGWRAPAIYGWTIDIETEKHRQNCHG